MGEKRYFCDWVNEPADVKYNCFIDEPLLKFLTIVSVIVGVVGSVIGQYIFKQGYTENLETYYESTYKYLDEIADNVISKDGINVSAIPENVIEYEITYEDNKITFEYSLDSNKEEFFGLPASMTVSLSKDFEILSKKPTYSSKEKYIKESKFSLSIFFPIILGFGTFIWLTILSTIAMFIAFPISKMHKKMDIKKCLS
jgi:hypothetical protein